MTRIAILSAAALVAVTGFAGSVDDASAGRSFNARPTRPYDCAELSGARGGNIWGGTFRGRREIEDFGRRTISVKACFTDERNCRNWLYNLQSEYNETVWRAECRPGMPSR